MQGEYYIIQNICSTPALGTNVLRHNMLDATPSKLFKRWKGSFWAYDVCGAANIERPTSRVVNMILVNMMEMINLGFT